MTLKEWLFDEDRGVSPVIGVILMVAITVILAAVIATFVMNMGPPENQAPTTSLDFDADEHGPDAHLAIQHDGGSAVPPSELSKTDTGTLNETEFDSINTLSGEFTASDMAVVTNTTAPGSGNLADMTIDVIWTNPDSDETQILDTWEGENA